MVAPKNEDAAKFVQRVMNNVARWATQNGLLNPLSAAALVDRLSGAQLEVLLEFDARHADMQKGAALHPSGHQILQKDQEQIAALLQKLGYRSWSELRLAHPQLSAAVEAELKKRTQLAADRIERERVQAERAQMRAALEAQKKMEQQAREVERARQLEAKARVQKERAQQREQERAEQALAKKVQTEEARKLREQKQIEQAARSWARLALPKEKPARPPKQVTPQEPRIRAPSKAQRAAVENQTQAVTDFMRQTENLRPTALYDLSPGQLTHLLSWVTQALNTHASGFSNPDSTTLSPGLAQTYATQVRAKTQVGLFFSRQLLRPVSSEVAAALGSANREALVLRLSQLRLDLIRQIERHPPAKYSVIDRLRAALTQEVPGASQPPLDPLSSYGLRPQEADVLKYLLQGQHHGQIAQRMGASLVQVRGYESEVRKKLGLTHPDTAAEVIARYPEVLAEGQANGVANGANGYAAYQQRLWFDLAHWQPGPVFRRGGVDTAAIPVPPLITPERAAQLAQLLGQESAQQVLERAAAPEFAEPESASTQAELRQIAAYQESVSQFMHLDALNETAFKKLFEAEARYLLHALTYVLNKDRAVALENPMAYAVPDNAEVSRLHYDIKKKLGLPSHFFSALEQFSEGNTARFLFTPEGLGQAFVARLEGIRNALLEHLTFPAVEQTGSLTRAVSAPTHSEGRPSKTVTTQELTQWVDNVNSIRGVDLYGLSEREAAYGLKVVTEALNSHRASPLPHYAVEIPPGLAHEKAAQGFRSTLGLGGKFSRQLQVFVQNLDDLPAQTVAALGPHQTGTSVLERLRSDLLRHLQRMRPDLSRPVALTEMNRLRAAATAPYPDQPRLGPLDTYGLSASETKFLAHLLMGRSHAQIVAHMNFDEIETARAYESRVRQKLGLTHPDSAGELLARYGAAAALPGQELFADLEKILGQEVLHQQIIDPSAPLHQALEALSESSVNTDPVQIGNVYEEMLKSAAFARQHSAVTVEQLFGAPFNAASIQPSSIQPSSIQRSIQRGDINKLSFNAVQVLEGILQSKSAAEIAADSALSVPAVQVLTVGLPALLGVSSLPQLIERYSGAEKQLLTDVSSMKAGRVHFDRYRAKPKPKSGQGLQAANLTPEPKPAASPERVAQRLMSITDAEVKALWAHVDGGLNTTEIGSLIGLSKESVRAFLTNFPRGYTPNGQRSEIEAMLQSVMPAPISGHQSAADFLWQLVLDRQKWVERQSFVPVFREADLQAATQNMTPTDFDFLRAWIKHGDAPAALAAELKVGEATISKYKARVNKLLGTASLEEIKLRTPGGLAGLLTYLEWRQAQRRAGG